jgi:hypothetical protein
VGDEPRLFSFEIWPAVAFPNGVRRTLSNPCARKCLSPRCVRVSAFLGMSVAYSSRQGGVGMLYPILVMAADDETFALVRRVFGLQARDVDFTAELPMAEALLRCVPYPLFIADLALTDEPAGQPPSIASFARRQSSATRIVVIDRPETSASGESPRGSIDVPSPSCTGPMRRFREVS